MLPKIFSKIENIRYLLNMYECAVSLISSKNIIWKMKKIKNGNLIQNTGVNVGGNTITRELE